MKRILTTIAALCIASTAFAGKGFRTIHFTSYWTETQKSVLDMEPPVASMSTRAEGEIIINAEDSTLSIGAEGKTPQEYKLTQIDEVIDDKGRSCQSVYFKMKDKAGGAYSVSVERHYDLRFVKVYIFPNGNMTHLVYGCEYLKKLK